MDPSKGFLDWTARICLDSSELRETLVVHIFLAVPPENPIEWIGAPGYVDSHYIPPYGGNGPAVNEGYVHLNAAITKYSDLHSFNEDVVEPYLTKELHWRVQKGDLMTPIPTANLTSLEITILSAMISLDPITHVPTQGEVREHPQITAGRQGGHAHLLPSS